MNTEPFDSELLHNFGPLDPIPIGAVALCGAISTREGPGETEPLKVQACPICVALTESPPVADAIYFCQWCYDRGLRYPGNGEPWGHAIGCPAKAALAEDRAPVGLETAEQPCEHVWVTKRMGGRPDDADSAERVRFCEKCGDEDSGETTSPAASDTPKTDFQVSITNQGVGYVSRLREKLAELGEYLWPDQTGLPNEYRNPLLAVRTRERLLREKLAEAVTENEKHEQQMRMVEDAIPNDFEGSEEPIGRMVESIAAERDEHRQFLARLSGLLCAAEGDDLIQVVTAIIEQRDRAQSSAEAQRIALEEIKVEASRGLCGCRYLDRIEEMAIAALAGTGPLPAQTACHDEPNTP